MPIPDYQSPMLPVLRFLKDHNEYSLAATRQRIAQELNLTACWFTSSVVLKESH